MGLKQLAGRLVRRFSGDTLMVRSLQHALVPSLRTLAASLPEGARVLDVGAKNALYRSIFKHCEFLTLDIESKYQPDIIGNLLELDAVVPEASFDAIICTEVLEHVRSPKLALDQMRRALKPHGTLVASTPFLVPYHPDPSDYWRMTGEGWSELTREFSSTTLTAHGNQPLSVWYLAGMGWGMPLRLLDGLVFATFRRMRSNAVYLGILCQARR